MQLRFFCPRWGSESLSWDRFLEQVKAAGYDGVEYAVSRQTTQHEIASVREKINGHDLLLIAQHYDTNDADFNQHLDAYAAWFEKIRPFGVLRINSQTGKDFFTYEQNKTLIEVADAFSQTTGTAVFHETHRGKFSFAAHVTKPFLIAMPTLKLTLDASHWVNVAESYLADQSDAMRLATDRTEHIHARVGHPEGPQVSDPRAPEWQEALRIHVAWWDRVVERKRAGDGNELITITPEFGPAPYMMTLPFTQEPVASQWDMNVCMMNLLKERYRLNDGL